MNRKLVPFLCVAALVYSVTPATAQMIPSGSRGVPSSQGIFLVFPFENDGANGRLDWLGEGLEELTIQRLASAGQQVFTHAGRAAELDRNGLPASARFSHATMLKIGAELDLSLIHISEPTRH